MCLLVLAQTHGLSATSDLTGHDTGSLVGCSAACLQRDEIWGNMLKGGNDKDPSFKLNCKILGVEKKATDSVKRSFLFTMSNSGKFATEMQKWKKNGRKKTTTPHTHTHRQSWECLNRRCFLGFDALKAMCSAACSWSLESLSHLESILCGS